MARFSNLETGQVATVDATISLEIITEAAARLCPTATSLLDIGCGAGNYTIKMLSKLPRLDCTLVDLSMPMLESAQTRVRAQTDCVVETVQGDVRSVSLQRGHYDIVLAGAVLHHLREDAEWLLVFQRLFESIAPGGCMLVSDLITQESAVVAGYMEERYAEYLQGIGGNEYQARVFDYIEREDSPRSLNYQLTLLQKVGFACVEILHKNMFFAAYAGIKG